MNQDEYERVFSQIKPALIRMTQSEAFRKTFEAEPLKTLRKLGVEIEPDLAEAMAGRTFSRFWAEHRARSESAQSRVQSRVQIRDLPPASLSDAELNHAVGGAQLSPQQSRPLSLETGSISDDEMVTRFAPPYVPVGPVVKKG